MVVGAGSVRDGVRERGWRCSDRTRSQARISLPGPRPVPEAMGRTSPRPPLAPQPPTAEQGTQRAWCSNFARTASRVRPGSGPVKHRSDCSRVLHSVDLPTLGRPTIARRSSSGGAGVDTPSASMLRPPPSSPIFVSSPSRSSTAASTRGCRPAYRSAMPSPVSAEMAMPGPNPSCVHSASPAADAAGRSHLFATSSTRCGGGSRRSHFASSTSPGITPVLEWEALFLRGRRRGGEREGWIRPGTTLIPHPRQPHARRCPAPACKEGDLADAIRAPRAVADAPGTATLPLQTLPSRAPALPGVDEEDRGVRSRQDAGRERRTPCLNGGRVPGRTLRLQARRVHHGEAQVSQRCAALLPVTRHVAAGCVQHQGLATAYQSVEQRRLAHVGPAHDGHLDVGGREPEA